MSEAIGGYSGKDIRYRGILTSRGLRLVALLCMTIGQLSFILLKVQNITYCFGEPFLPEWSFQFLEILQNASIVTIPLLLIAMFTDVLKKQENFIKALLTYFILAAVVYLGIVFILYTVIEVAIRSIPLVLRDLDSNQQVLSFMKRLLTRIIEGIMPGDGTIHVEYLNNSLEAMNVSFRLPTVHQLALLLENKGLPMEITEFLASRLASIPPENYAGLIVDTLHKIISAIPSEWYLILDEQILPAFCTRLASYLNINVFWDLFLYTSAYFFLSYKPKKMSGGMLVLFRSCASFPLMWMMISFLVVGTCRITGNVELPLWLSVLMSKQSLSSMIIFLALMMFEKMIESSYVDTYHTKEGLTEFSDSHIKSIYFSIFVSGLLILVSLVDLVLSTVPGLSYWGIGNAKYLWIGVPFLMLFSYNKKPKYKFFNVAIPLYYVAHYILIFYLAGEALDALIKWI